MISPRFLLFLLSITACATPVSAQTVVFDQRFDDVNLDSRVWDTVVDDSSSVEIRRGALSVESSGSPPAGLLTRVDKYPLFTRAQDDGEYDVFLLGVRLADKNQSAAFGLFSMPSGTNDARLPRGYQDRQRMSYAFQITPSKDPPNKHWVSTVVAGNAAAAADSTGADGFHTWEYGKVYDFRIQVTKHDTTWWGREHPYKNWMPLQDPALDIGYDGAEEGGRNSFGLFVSADDADLEIDRVYVTHFHPSVVETVLDQNFSGGKLDKTVWSIVVPEPTTDSVRWQDASIRIINRKGGSAWQEGTGIWTRPERFPLFERPKDSSRRIHVDFLGVALPSKAQRCALGLYSTGQNETNKLRFPNDLGPEGGLAYFFWVLPDNDRLVENSNQLRAGIINEKYAATDNYHHAWIWPYTEKRDLRLEITVDEVRWYLRKHADSAWRVLRDADEYFYRRPATPEDRNVGYWRPLYDPGTITQTNFDGSERHGRNRFGLFIHCSAAGSDGPVEWETGELTIQGIRVTTVAHDPAS